MAYGYRSMIRLADGTQMSRDALEELVEDGVDVLLADGRSASSLFRGGW